MQTWACGHEGDEGHSRLCPHLVCAGEVEYARVLRGQGLESDLCCPDCASLIKNGESIEWLRVCEACVELHEDNSYDLIEWIGKPEIKERLTPFDATLAETILSVDAAWAVAIAPLDVTRWVGFWQKEMFLIDGAEVAPICAAPPSTQKDGVWGGPHLAPSVSTSLDGRFAVLCHTRGRSGFVVDLEEKRVTMVLKKTPNTPFYVAFFQLDERNFLIHATDWMRFDISDPENGTLLSRREGHYSTFENGRLRVSPDSQWIVVEQSSRGGSERVVAWNLSRLLEEKFWESKEASPHRWLCSRDYLSDVPVAWVDNDRVAVWGISPDEELMLNGARVFDIHSGEEVFAFAGPSKKVFFGGGGRLFSAEDDGLHIWDASMGERLGRINGFKPQWQRGDFLIELNASRLSGSRVRAWNWLGAFD
ncbi:hypothetical protein IAD21_04389 [Abditibacteriota bacterium]|nr:hypothetical protein IAD21_04389 [Abditibacteriota bacterium]